MDLATLLRSAPPQKNINGKKLKKRGKLYQPRGDKLTLFHTAQAGEMIPIKINENCCRSDNWAIRIGYLSCLSHLRPMHLVKGQVLLDIISDFFSVVLLLGTGAPSMGRALLEMRGEVGRGTWREAGREEGGQRTLEPAGQQGDAEHPPSPQVRTYLCATAHGPRCQGHPPDSSSTCGLQT